MIDLNFIYIYFNLNLKNLFYFIIIVIKKYNPHHHLQWNTFHIKHIFHLIIFHLLSYYCYSINFSFFFCIFLSSLFYFVFQFEIKIKIRKKLIFYFFFFVLKKQVERNLYYFIYSHISFFLFTNIFIIKTEFRATANKKYISVFSMPIK